MQLKIAGRVGRTPPPSRKLGQNRLTRSAIASVFVKYRSRPTHHRLRIERGGLRAARDAQLVKYGGEIVFHRFFGEVQPFANLLVGQPLGEQGEDPALLQRENGEALHRGGIRPALHEVEHLIGERRIQHRVAGGDTGDRRRQ